MKKDAQDSQKAGDSAANRGDDSSAQNKPAAGGYLEQKDLTLQAGLGRDRMLSDEEEEEPDAKASQ